MQSSNPSPPPNEQEVFEVAAALPPNERAAYLDAVCEGRREVRAAVERLLVGREDAGFMRRAADRTAGPDVETELARLKPEEAGEQIGPYTLREQIGEGGFGTVWVADQEKPVRRRVALKIIKLGMDTKEVIARFEQERQALAMMDHPNIAKVLDAGATSFGRPYFVMELVRGIQITKYCDQANLPTAERLRLFIAVCNAVQHAHQKGIIHRDLKPSNILVTLHDGVPVPKVIDFGVAKATQQQRLTELTIYTQFEQMIGTPLYMSPEQAEMSGLDIDTRSDIYSLGVLLYELLVGRTPFDPEKLMKAGFDEMRRVIREQEPQRPSTFVSTLALELRTDLAKHRQTDSLKLAGQIRGDLDWIVMKALEKDRVRRYETANGLAQDIQRHLQSEPVQARQPTQFYRFRRMVRRNKLAFAAGGAVFTALVIGLAVSSWLFFKEKDARERAVAAEAEQTGLRERAEAQEKKATTEADKSQQIAQFLKDMLKGVGPSAALGRDTTMLREILDNTAARIGSDLEDQPEVEAELRSIMSIVYWELYEIEKAEAMCRESLEILTKMHGREHEAVADALADLGGVLYRQRRLEEAEINGREVLAIRRKVLGHHHWKVADALERLSHTLSALDKLSESEAFAREAVAMHLKLLGSESLKYATSLQALAIALGRQGQIAECEAIHRKVLTIRIKKSPDGNAEVAYSLALMAVAQRQQGKLSESEEANREQLTIRRKLFGPEHPELLDAIGDLAGILGDQEKWPEAAELFREMLGIVRKQKGNEHPVVATALVNLADILSKQLGSTEAEILYREALEMRRRLLGREHPDVAATLNSLGVLLSAKGRLADAEAIVREALEIGRKQLGSEHRNTATLLYNLAFVREKQHNFPEAETLYREALALRTKLLGEAHEESLRALGQLVTVLLEQGKLSEASELAVAGLAMARNVQESSPKAFTRMLELGAHCFYRENLFAESEPLYRELLESRLSRYEAEDGGVLTAKASLARLLADWAWADCELGSEPAKTNSQAAEHAREAETLLRECLEVRMRESKPDDWRTKDVQSRLGGAVLAVAFSDRALTIEDRGGKLAEAKSLLLEGGEDLLRDTNTNRRKYQRDALVRILRFYEATEQRGKAAEWQEKLADFDRAAKNEAAGE